VDAAPAGEEQLADGLPTLDLLASEARPPTGSAGSTFLGAGRG
jgi:hypothetical protein